MPALSGWAAAELFAPWLRHGGVALLLAGCRCGPLLLAVPGLGVGGRLAALGFGTLLIAPLLAPAVLAAGGAGPGLPDLLPALAPLCGRELLLGGTLALAAALPWAVAHAVGTLLDGGRSAGPTGRSREAASLYGMLALALFFGLGGARIALGALAASYELLPILTPQPSQSAPLAGAGAGRGLILLSGRLLWLAIRLALPLLGAQLLAELLLALPGRSLGFAVSQQPRRSSPVRSLIWLGVLALGAHALFPQFAKLLALWPTLLRQALSAY